MTSTLTSIVYNTASQGLEVKPYIGQTTVTGLIELDTLVKTVGADILLEAIGRDRAKLHFNLT